MFYFITLYYEFKAQFPDDGNAIYRYHQYYSDKTFRQRLIENAADLFLAYTVKILGKTASVSGRSGNVNNWVRSAACEGAFLTALRDEMASDYEIENRYRNYCNQFKA